MFTCCEAQAGHLNQTNLYPFDLKGKHVNRYMQTLCANAPRTFLNEDKCFLSMNRNVCGAKKTVDIDIELSSANIRKMYQITGGDSGSNTRYVYSVEGLRIEDDDVPLPCERGKTSRWMPVKCGSSKGPKVGTGTVKAFNALFSKTSDKNKFMRDLLFPRRKLSCDKADKAKKGFEIKLKDGKCLKNVHPNEGQVFDMVSPRVAETVHPKLSCIHIG